MKFKVGGLTPAEDAERFIAARRAAGDDFILMADANQGWKVHEAVDFARRVADQACTGSRSRAFGQRPAGDTDVRLMSGQAVCAGQSEFSAGGCRDLFVAGAVDFCNFDASWSGGPTEWRRVAAMAATFGVRMAHHEEAQVSSHLLCSIPHGTFVEIFHEQRDPIWHHLIANKPELRDGSITLTERPGLGWELDWDYVERHRVAVETRAVAPTPGSPQWSPHDQIGDQGEATRARCYEIVGCRNAVSTSSAAARAAAADRRRRRAAAGPLRRPCGADRGDDGDRRLDDLQQVEVVEGHETEVASGGELALGERLEHPDGHLRSPGQDCRRRPGPSSSAWVCWSAKSPANEPRTT